MGKLESSCLIDSFLFETRDTDAITHKLSIGWSEYARVGNNPKRQATGKWDEEVEISGRLLVKSVHALEQFEVLAKKSLPVRMTFGTGESFMVVVVDIERTKKDFIRDGHFVTQEYKVNVKRYWE